MSSGRVRIPSEAKSSSALNTSKTSGNDNSYSLLNRKTAFGNNEHSNRTPSQKNLHSVTRVQVNRTSPSRSLLEKKLSKEKLKGSAITQGRSMLAQNTQKNLHQKQESAKKRALNDPDVSSTKSSKSPAKLAQTQSGLKKKYKGSLKETGKLS